jgi:hypothetical protein
MPSAQLRDLQRQRGEVIGRTAVGYIGEENSRYRLWLRWSHRRPPDRLPRQQCEATPLSRTARRWLCADPPCATRQAQSVGGNGSGLIAYDSDDIITVLMLAKNRLPRHRAERQGSPRRGTAIERCSVDTTGRDGIHMTRRGFRITTTARATSWQPGS